MANHAQDASASIIPLEIAGHPDFSLIAAWESYKVTWRARKVPPDDDETGQDDALYELGSKYRDLIEELPAHTAAGLAIKLKYLFMAHNETLEADLAMIQGEPAGEDEMDLTNKMLLGLIADAERMQG